MYITYKQTNIVKCIRGNKKSSEKMRFVNYLAADFHHLYFATYACL